MAAGDPFATEYVTTLKKPGKIASQQLHSSLKKNIASGIFSTYSGFLSTSDLNGETEFPRKHEETKVELVITDKITPNIITENTVHHWDLVPGVPTEIYSMERKLDEKTQLYYWDTKKIPLPANGRVSRFAIVIIAKPEDIYVPTGATVANNKPNLVLPTIYVKKGIKIYSSTLYVLNLKNFFGPITREYKPAEKKNGYREVIK